ncbi:SDR family oxidoreductase [Streptomyces sp. NBC_01481]|uniref:SDR family oxidoreductase n=1 Tax=Streptomyces sp. NBC_01481 TaxID=2975869 RepID=UPI00224EEE27|nr:SDR family oxidoreductase [Streptomyces sp. NBC_01481]MCX4584650.1 SDR family oxidoreductase [Streptomyces sp. NBC_01481]
MTARPSGRSQDPGGGAAGRAGVLGGRLVDYNTAEGAVVNLTRAMAVIPFDRVAEAEEIAGVVAFLACSDARCMTGAQVPVDGGLSAMSGQPRIEM